MPGLQLDLGNVPFVGRWAELAHLDAALQTVASQQQHVSRRHLQHYAANKLQAVLIQGSMGTGKTYLMEQWSQDPDGAGAACVYLGRGACSPVQKHAVPYAAITMALVDLIQQLSLKNSDRLNHIVNQRIAPTDIQALLELIPPLGAYITVDDDTSSSGSSSFWTTDTASSTSSSSHSASSNSLAATSVDRFAYLVCSLLASVTRSLDTPSVLWIDNAQWADENSYQVLQAMLDQDAGIDNCLLVLSERVEEATLGTDTRMARLVRASHKPGPNPHRSGSAQMSKVADSEQYTTSAHGNIITLGNLSVDELNDMLAQLLELKPDDTQPLARILYDKTLGNPLFCTQFLDCLQRRQLLLYSFVDYKWTFDESQLAQSLTHVADNVASLVLERIETLQDKTRFLLQVASFLGFSFDQDDLAIVWQGMSVVLKVDQLVVEETKQCANGMCRNQALLETKIEVVQLLKECVSIGLLAPQGNGWYSFTHNTIQAAFLEMADKRVNDDIACCSRDELAAIYLRLGFVILGLYRLRPEKKCKLFAAVEVLNRGVDHLTDCHSKLTLAKLNVEAAEEAAKRSAFIHAADYLSLALDVIGKTIHPWVSDYELTLYLYQRSAEVEVVLGDHDKVKAATDAVILNAKTDLEKVPAYTVLAKSLRIQNKLKESRDTMLCALAILGESFPKRPNQTTLIWSRNEANAIKSMSNDEISLLPVITSETDRYRMTLLSMLCVNSYLQSDQLFKTVAMRRGLARTAQLGLSKASPAIFALYAQALAHEGEYQDAFRFGELAEQLSKQKSSKENRAIAIFFLVAFVDHLRKPLYQSLRLLEKGFDTGMSSGDPESAFICASTKLAFQDCCSTPLSIMVNDSAGYFRQARQYRQDYLALEFLFAWQYAANLAGETDDPLVFDGRVMGEEELMSHAIQQGGIQVRYMEKLQMQLYVFMGEWESAAELLARIPVRFQRRLTGHYSYAIICSFAAIISYKKYDGCKCLKALATGDNCRKALKRLVSMGCVNVAASLWFVEAQHAAAKRGKLADVKEKFEKAIVALHRSGLRHLEAVACENLATFALSVGDQELASHYIKRSYSLYQDWEAGAVMRRMKDAYEPFLGDVESSVRSSGRNTRRSAAFSASTSSSTFDPKASWWSQSPEQGLNLDDGEQ